LCFGPCRRIRAHDYVEQRALDTVRGNSGPDLETEIDSAAIIHTDIGLFIAHSIVGSKTKSLHFIHMKTLEYIALKINRQKIAQIDIANHDIAAVEHVYFPKARRALHIGIQRRALSVGKHTFKIILSGIKRLAHVYGIGKTTDNHGDIVVGMEILRLLVWHRPHRSLIIGLTASLCSKDTNDCQHNFHDSLQSEFYIMRAHGCNALIDCLCIIFLTLYNNLGAKIL